VETRTKPSIMKTIIAFIKEISTSDTTKQLGRWTITYCNKTQHKIIDLANEDHCGVCYSTKYHNVTYIKQNHIMNTTPIIDLE
jgi:hypothetical protein